MTTHPAETATSTERPTLTPRLVVADAPKAVDFYTSAMGATELSRHADDSGTLLNVDLVFGTATFTLTEESEQSTAPSSLGGSGVLLTLLVEDADEVGSAMVSAGAEVVFGIADQFYGRREGRLRDPFGHLWIISQGAVEG